MTERKITYALNRIKTCKENGFVTEALLKNYHLNLDIIKHILSTYSADYSFEGKKIKNIVNDFLEEISVNPQLRSILNKKNLKVVKPWLQKMDQFFKTLKIKSPANTNALLTETEKIFSILNISISKLFSQHKVQKSI
ncbi:MAG TPA: hypothetical protein PL029_02735 [Bacteroidia bacterium]|nr:hypothetical protein [Bacteroidia bacterium]